MRLAGIIEECTIEELIRNQVSLTIVLQHSNLPMCLHVRGAQSGVESDCRCSFEERIVFGGEEKEED